jgi:hypothetical protein
VNTIRRVVTGVGNDGKAHFISDGPALVLGDADTGAAFVWATDSTPTVPTDGKDQATADRNFLPGVGGTRFVVCTFPPGFGVVMPEAGFGGDHSNEGAQPNVSVGDLNAAGSPTSLDRLIMHATPTIDYATVLSGEVDLILDSGEVVRLGPSDTIIQNGTMHGWRNSYDKPVVIALAVIGAPTKGI